MKPEEIDEYLEFCKQGGDSVIPRFKGHEPFEYLLEQGRISPYFTTIRVMYTGTLDKGYHVNEEGMLELICEEGNSPALDPREVLSIENAPDGWELGKSRPAKNK